MERLKRAVVWCFICTYGVVMWGSIVPSHAHTSLYHDHVHDRSVIDLIIDLMHEWEHLDTGDDNDEFYLFERSLSHPDKPVPQVISWEGRVEYVFVITSEEEGSYPTHPPPDQLLPYYLNHDTYRGPPSFS